jgi:hypothetical protein
MDPFQPALSPHPAGEQPSVEDWSATADTFAGRVHVEWDRGGLVTPLGQLPFFIEYLKQAGLFAGWVADCPLTFTSPNAPSQRDLLGTVLLSVLSGHYRYTRGGWPEVAADASRLLRLAAAERTVGTRHR